MKRLLLLYLLLAGFLVHSQERYRTSGGTIHFNASTPLEDIDAINNKVNAILTATGDFAAVLLVKEFEFRRKLMQEHFNENFMESSSYPKAQYRGSIQGFTPGTIGSNPVKLLVKGQMTIHGVTREMESTVSLSREGENIRLLTEFIIEPEEYDIEVPSILFNKIAEEVSVDVSLDLSRESSGK